MAAAGAVIGSAMARPYGYYDPYYGAADCGWRIRRVRVCYEDEV
jgi:hypothetical protein